MRDIFGGYNKICLMQGMSSEQKVNMCLPVWMAFGMISKNPVHANAVHIDTVLSAIHFADVAIDNGKLAAGRFKNHVVAAMDAIVSLSKRIEAGGARQLMIDERGIVSKALRIFDLVVDHVKVYEARDMINQVCERAGIGNKIEDKKDVVMSRDETENAIALAIVENSKEVQDSKAIKVMEKILPDYGHRFNVAGAARAFAHLEKIGMIKVVERRVGVSKPKRCFVYCGPERQIG